MCAGVCECVYGLLCIHSSISPHAWLPGAPEETLLHARTRTRHERTVGHGSGWLRRGDGFCVGWMGGLLHPSRTGTHSTRQMHRSTPTHTHTLDCLCVTECPFECQVHRCIGRVCVCVGVCVREREFVCAKCMHSIALQRKFLAQQSTTAFDDDDDDGENTYNSNSNNINVIDQWISATEWVCM